MQGTRRDYERQRCQIMGEKTLFEDDLTKSQIRALQHVYDYSFSPFTLLSQWRWVNMQPVRAHSFDGTKFEGLTFLEWYDLYARGLICRNGRAFELTREGVDLLARGGWL